MGTKLVELDKFPGHSEWLKRSVKNHAYPPLIQISFSGPTARNLIFHLWPVNGEQWRWNVEQLLQRIDLFNGRRIIGIVTDRHSEPSETVEALFEGHGCEFIYGENNSTGECVTFPRLLEMIKSLDHNEVTFYAHAKGVRYNPLPYYVKRWAEVQYRTCLDNWATVKKQLTQYPLTGSFKRKGLFTAHHLLTDWHYSGTFFWIRHALAFQRDILSVPVFYGGVEVWPGIYHRYDETGCLFAEIDRQTPYNDHDWRTAIDPEFKKWEQSHVGAAVPMDLQNPESFDGYTSPRTEQRPGELEFLIRTLLEHNINSVLTIGAMHGGTEFHIARRFRQAGKEVEITMVDRKVTEQLLATFYKIRSQFCQDCYAVAGDSTSDNVQRMLSDHYDAVFIDGDHGYRGVKGDWELALSKCPRIVGFHDIVNSDFHTVSRCCVDRLWREIKDSGKYRTEEFISGGGEWGGIGVVILDD